MTEKSTQAILVGRYWHMPDGTLIRNICGGADGDGGAGDGGAGDGVAEGSAGSAGSSSAGSDDLTADLDRSRKDLKAVRSEASTYRRKLRELEDKVDGVDFEQYNALKKEADDRKAQNLADKGQYDELTAENKRRFDAQLTKSNDTAEMWKDRFTEQVVDNVLLGAATDKAINANEVVTLIRTQYKFNVTDSGDVEILGNDGNVVLNDDGKPSAPEAVMSTFMASRAHLCKPTGGGAGSRGGSGPTKPGSQASSDLHGVERIRSALKKRMEG